MAEDSNKMTRFQKLSLLIPLLCAAIAASVGVILNYANKSKPVVAGNAGSRVQSDLSNPDYQNQPEQHYQLSIQASIAYWQTNEILISKEEEAIITTYPPNDKTNSVNIYPSNSGFGFVGAGGYSKFAGRTFRKPDAPEGCLLMKIGDGTVVYWTQDVQQITVKTPGTISFSINDDLTSNGHGLSTDYGDNTGALCVVVAVIKKPD